MPLLGPARRLGPPNGLGYALGPRIAVAGQQQVRLDAEQRVQRGERLMRPPGGLFRFIGSFRSPHMPPDILQLQAFGLGKRMTVGNGVLRNFTWRVTGAGPDPMRPRRGRVTVLGGDGTATSAITRLNAAT